MKSRIFALILALCCLSLLLVACKDEACVEHVDANNDLACDVCGDPVEASTTAPETTEPETTEPETVPPCDKHVDAEPADEYCDVCGANIIVVFLPSEPAETETRVGMEVITAPADANPADYIDLGEPKQPATSMETETEGIDYNFVMHEDIVWVEEVITEIETVEDSPFEEETTVNVLGTRYSVIDLVTGEKIIPSISVKPVDFVYPSTIASHGVSVYTDTYYFVVTKTIYSMTEETLEEEDEPQNVYSVAIEKTAYTYNGTQIVKATWNGTYDTEMYTYVSEDDTSVYDLWKLDQYDDTRPEYAYFTYDDSVYLINKETGKLILGGSAYTFIDRPAFDFANDAYGYVADDYTLYVYDLSQWLECVYTYTVPGYLEDFRPFLLENGNLLIQAKLSLPNDAVSYDLQTNYNKYDLVYILIDPAAKTATEVEFGYWIEECVTEYELFTDKATNVFVVYPIKQSMIDYSGEAVLVVGNDMSVLCQLPDLNYSTLAHFGSGYVRMYNDILNCYEILDSKFNFVTYVPSEANFFENFFSINGKFYTVADGKIQALNTVLDANLKGEYVVNISSGNLVVRETVEVPAEEEGEPSTYEQNYYVVSVDANGFKLTKIGKETTKYYEVFYEFTGFGYITKVYVYEEDSPIEGAIDNEASFLVFYNQNGVKIGSTQETDINLQNFEYYNCNEDDGVFTLAICYRNAGSYEYVTYVIQ